MARIPEEQIERLKQDVSLVRLVEAKGIALKRQGKDWLGRCPFHDDRTPSLVVSPATNLWHCLGACNVGGSVIDWVMKSEGVSFRHAVELLRHELPHLAAESAAPATEPAIIKRATVPKLASPLALSGDDTDLLGQVADFYHETLTQSPEALAYLAKRGLNHPDLIDTFKLGYANRTLAYRLPNKNRQAGAEQRGRLQALGVLRDSGHEHLNGSLVVPLFDDAGQVVQLYGRKLLDNLRAGTPLHLYLAGPQRGVWNRDGLRGATEVILCEALIDAMTFWCAGFKSVTTAYGVNGFTDELLAALQAEGVERVKIAFDRDSAGEAGAERVAAQLNAVGIDAYRVRFPKGMDANEYALKVSPAQQSLGMVLRTAEWMSNGQRARPEPVPEPSSLAAEIAAEPSPSTSPEAPAVTVVDIPTDASEHEITLRFDDRHYRVRGLAKNLSPELLKVNVLVKQGAGVAVQGCTNDAGGRMPGAFHVDTLDLYSARARAAYLKQASQELALPENILKADLGAVLLKLEELQDQLIRGTLAKDDKAPTMTDLELKAALALLKAPDLMARVLADFGRCGVVGEEANKQVAYLAAVSRKLDRPLAVLVQSSSAAGKSSLMDAVLRFMPEEERVQYSAMTGQSLYYLGDKDLKHKILAISEEEGAHNASYALKLLQSEGEVSIASTGKNAVTGNLETQEYRVEGPVMLFSTTTAIDLDEELLNRCLVLSVDESREQTQAIHAEQRRRRTLDGLRAGAEREQLTRLHQNAQRLLRPLKVVNPWAERLTFLSDKTRTRRDHEKYLALIDAIALLHQHQRPVKRELCPGGVVVEYVEVTLADLALANRLAHAVLGRTLDELPPQTRKLLTQISEQVRAECRRQNLAPKDYRFSRKEVRDGTGWGNTQLKVHLGRLEEMEYLLVHRGKRGQSMEYELLYQGEGQQGDAFLLGLIDVDSLRAEYDAKKSGPVAHLSGSGRPQVGTESATGREVEITVKALGGKPSRQQADDDTENAPHVHRNGASYRTVLHPAPEA
ncbi:DNA primase catalytic core [Fluviicoccus keumensis]|uniref:DNA primase catalytic core n=1 Tax=Fluviicoccus keumensis TaxID=1435465 RepID=A0A4Q7YM96_9GAMM|nr:CHC2 zinc finger domain-containing protein [Fluviicoccus keumensis]RZU38480.1 DNA primase catalytic core [Fluviicoccus keumensis]RZU38484.1 DNA primase catalytic core [Fluviicoccus keumensis]